MNLPIYAILYLETKGFPDAVNHPSFPLQVTKIYISVNYKTVRSLLEMI